MRGILDLEGGRWNGDPDKPWKEGTAEPVHIGFKEEWDLNETRRRKHATHGVWTEPLVEGAKKSEMGEKKHLIKVDTDVVTILRIVAFPSKVIKDYHRHMAFQERMGV